MALYKSRFAELLFNTDSKSKPNPSLSIQSASISNISTDKGHKRKLEEIIESPAKNSKSKEHFNNLLKFCDGSKEESNFEHTATDEEINSKISNHKLLYNHGVICL